MRTASRVFGAIALFAFAAAALFIVSGRDRGVIQGALVLGMFGLANAYLWRVLGHGGRGELDGLVVPGERPLDEVQHSDPATIHLPGPSIFPAVFSVSAGLILIGLLTNYAVSYAGAALFVVATIGWVAQAVGEHRYAQAHASHDSAAPAYDHQAVALAHQISAFRSLHGGTKADVQHLGRGAARIVLVGADGTWGDIVTDDIGAAAQACQLGGVDTSPVWAAGAGVRLRTGRETWEQMGGHSAPAPHGPRDGYTQVGAQVFLAIGAFAFAAAALFAASGRNRQAVQGTLILAMFGIANVYLYVFMRNARGGPDDAQYAAASGIAAEPLDPAPAMDPADIHLPGPSIFPAVFSLSAGLILIGLLTNYAVSLAGAALFVVATVGWVAQAVGEHRQALAGDHGAHGAVAVDHISAEQTH